jgi:hypothetical protein
MLRGWCDDGDFPSGAQRQPKTTEGRVVYAVRISKKLAAPSCISSSNASRYSCDTFGRFTRPRMTCDLCWYSAAHLASTKAAILLLTLDLKCEDIAELLTRY